MTIDYMLNYLQLNLLTYSCLSELRTDVLVPALESGFTAENLDKLLGQRLSHRGRQRLWRIFGNDISLPVEFEAYLESAVCNLTLHNLPISAVEALFLSCYADARLTALLPGDRTVKFRTFDVHLESLYANE